MARIRSEAKRSAILKAAIEEVAEHGLAAATSKIAHRAGIASGTLFTYFSTKNELLNALYLELKLDFYAHVNSGFPNDGSLKDRARHLWISYLGWSIDNPQKCKVSRLLNVSDVVTPITRSTTTSERSAVDKIIQELDLPLGFKELPPGFAAATLSAIQDAAVEFISKEPAKRKEIIDRSFETFWKMAT